eukprot:g9511.t1
MHVFTHDVFGEVLLQCQDSNAAQATAEPKRSTAAKSVLNQSTVMSSSAAGALGSLLSAKPSEAASGTATPKVPPTGTTPEPKHSGAGAKSVLNQSTVMSSSAAGALGSLISKAKAPSTAPVPEGEASAPVAKSTDVPAKAPQTMKRREASHGSAGCGADTEKVPGPELKQLELGSVGSFVRNHRMLGVTSRLDVEEGKLEG